MLTLCTFASVAMIATEWQDISQEIFTEFLLECLTTIPILDAIAPSVKNISY